ncbi:MAG: DUF444 family protein [Planctomycetota bacterium]|nr:DUF444 family protein [Planctomycetota bacterium]
MPIRKIDQDHTRFREIVRGRIKRDLEKYVTSGEMVGRQGDQFVSIPIPQIRLPKFRFGENPQGGIGQGEGDPGETVDTKSEEGGQAGDNEGQHIIEVDVSFEELARILSEELELPDIEPKGAKNLTASGGRFSSISRVGPASLRHFKRTFREALKREITTGTYDPENPRVVPVSDDVRYRAIAQRDMPVASAAIIYMMDVSGSMGREQKEVVRNEAFWIDTWLRHQYKNLEVNYIVHDAAAHLVDQKTFFSLRESGGTKISSAYELCSRLIQERYPTSEWNIYPFHFSDGDNWSSRDTERCVELLRNAILPSVNQFCYGQVKSAYGSGQFKKDLDRAFDANDGVVTTDILNREGILPSIKEFLGKGR